MSAHPVHLSSHQSDPERVQRLMLAASQSESIGEAFEVHFIDGVENLHHGMLDNFIFQRRDAQRPHLAIGLGYVGPFRRLRAILPRQQFV